mmetsp:Transcript_24547/g.58335  ORF Transcript_24547/g.58335 Transcript_24547/m.58335 type:complete len:638 (+) Transcript_24547:1496-3409(+)
MPRRAVVRTEISGEVLVGQREDAQGPAGHALLLGRDRVGARLVELHHLPVRLHDVGAAREESLRRALDEELVRLLAVRPRQDGHALAVAVELERGEDLGLRAPVVVDGLNRAGRVRFALLQQGRLLGSVRQADLLDEHLEAGLGGLSHAHVLGPLLVVLDARRVAERRDGGQHAELGGRLSEVDGRLDRPDGRVGDPADRVRGHLGLAPRQHDLDAAHLVGGERPRLVRADDIGAPERLDGRELAHDGVLGGHLARAEREAGGDDRGQALGDRRDGERDGDLEVVDAALEDGAVHGVEEVAVVDGPDEDADDADDLREHVPELVELLLERRVLLVLAGALHGLLDLADLGGHADVRDDAARDAAHDGGGGEHDVRLGLHHELVVLDVGRRGVLRHALALARELALVDAQAGGAELRDARVGRHAVAHLDLDDVAGHQLARADRAHLAVAQDAGVLGLQLLERLQRRLGVGLLPHAHDGVQDQDHQDHDGLDVGQDALLVGVLARVVEVRQRERHAGRGQQDLDERVVELLQDQLPQRRGVLLVQLVPPVLGPPGLHLRAREAHGGVHLQVRAQLRHGRRRRRPAQWLALSHSSDSDPDSPRPSLWFVMLLLPCQSLRLPVLPVLSFDAPATWIFPRC